MTSSREKVMRVEKGLARLCQIGGRAETRFSSNSGFVRGGTLGR
jgi:hypothetical protein